MDITLVLVIAMFSCLMILLMTGFPVAFVLAGVAILFGGLGLVFDVIDIRVMTLLPIRIFDTILQNDLLLAIPLFIAMGVILEKSGIAEDLLDNMSRLFGRLRGGLVLSVTLVGALLAASTGIVGATVVTMGLLSLPTLIKKGYDPALATGTIAASGTLGQIIPPSIVLILLTDVMSNSWSLAQQQMGIFSPAPITTGQVFTAALIPGAFLVALYLIFQIATAYLKPHLAPIQKAPEAAKSLSVLKIILALLPPFFLIVAVLGSIVTGIATPTKAAAIGAVGALILAGIKKGSKNGSRAAWLLLLLTKILFALAYFHGLRAERGIILGIGYSLSAFIAVLLGYLICDLYKRDILKPAMDNTLLVSTMIFSILISAALFSLVFRSLGGDDLVRDFLTHLGGGFWGAFAVVMVLMFLLGFFLDFIEIIFIIVPVVAPVLLSMDASPGPLWLAVVMAINLQTSFLTPPFGFALFYLRGVMPETIPTKTLYKGVIPFILIQIAILLILVFYPSVLIV